MEVTAESVQANLDIIFVMICAAFVMLMHPGFALLEAGLVHFVASDCHGTQRRPPGLRRAYQMIAGRWGADLAKRLVSDNPRAVVQNRPLPEAERPEASEAS